MTFIFEALPAIIAAVTLGLLGWISQKVFEFIKAFKAEHAILLESQRNQLKAQIVQIYETAKARGYISHMELDTLNRLTDSYFALGGNHYIHEVVKKANALPVGGEEIPAEH